MCLTKETIEEEMRGGSFDSPTADHPSSHVGVPANQLVVYCRPSDADEDTVSPSTPDSASAFGRRALPSSQRKTLSVACLRPLTNATADRCATRSMPNVRWIRDAATAAKCVCDATDERTSGASDGGDRPDTTADPDRRTAARWRIADVRRRSVERFQRVSRSDPDVLKLPPSSSTSNRHEHCDASRPSSLDRSRPSSLDRSRPSSLDRPIPSSLHRLRPSSLDASRPSLDRSRPSSLHRPRSSSLHRSRPSSLHRLRPSLLDASRPSLDRSRPSSLDRPRRQRQRSLPPSRDAVLLPVNVIFPTANRRTATV